MFILKPKSIEKLLVLYDFIFDLKNKFVFIAIAGRKVFLSRFALALRDVYGSFAHMIRTLLPLSKTSLKGTVRGVGVVLCRFCCQTDPIQFRLKIGQYLHISNLLNQNQPIGWILGVGKVELVKTCDIATQWPYATNQCDGLFGLPRPLRYINPC